MYGAEGFVALNGVAVDAPNVAENYTLDVFESFSADQLHYMFFDKTALPKNPVNVVDGYVEAVIKYSTDSIIPTPYVTKNGTAVKAKIPALAHIGDGLGMYRVLRAT